MSMCCSHVQVQQASQLAALTQLRELQIISRVCPQPVLDACAQLTGEGIRWSYAPMHMRLAWAAFTLCLPCECASLTKLRL